MSETIQRTKLYEDVTERMLDHIRTETWAPGTKIPPEVELAKLFDVSRCTIREAVKSLQIAGFLRSRAGSGTFVSERAPTLLQTQALAGIMATPLRCASWCRRAIFSSHSWRRWPRRPRRRRRSAGCLPFWTA